MRLRTLLFLLLPLSVPAWIRGQLPADAQGLRDILDASIELQEHRYQSERRKIQELYAASIRTLAEHTSATGNLERVLLLRETADRFAQELPQPVGPPLSEDEAFLRLQDTWERLHGELRKQRAVQRLQDYQNYTQTLEPLQRQWTREGNIDAALAIQQERRRISALPDLAELEAEAAWTPMEWPAAAEAPPAAVLAPLQANMVLYLPFERSDRTRRITDRSRERHTGTSTGTELEMQGRLGLAMRFDGAESNIVFPTAASLQITGDLTIAFWTRPEAFGARRNPIEKAYGGEYTITQEPNGNLNFFHGTAGANREPYQGFNSNTPLTENEWTHVVLVRDSSAQKLFWYFNGTLIREAASSYPGATASENPVRIGRGYAGSFSGLLDEIMILNTALNARQVRQLYQALGGR